jgi:membrane peptidoglycan carboxypeptidase
VLWTVILLTVGVGAFGVGLFTAPVDLTVPPPTKAALILDGAGQLIATIRPPQTQEEVSGEDVPVVMRQAIVSAEDEHFFDHAGVDPRAIARALVRDVTGSTTQGGSTITQQYVKNVYVGSERTPLRKLREAAIAVRLEQRMSKDDILTQYLNTLYLGNGLYGVQAAAKYYFGVPIQQVSRAQAAMLAGIAPAPSAWNPATNFEAARSRQLYTLNRMVANRYLTVQEASDAYRVPPVLKVEKAQPETTIAPEFRDLVETQLRRDLGDQQLFRGGLRVTTTLDSDLQKALVQAVADVVPKPTDPQAAAIAIDPRSGDIKALTTKRDGGYSRNGFNLATQAARSTGSVIKPFTLAAALENGASVNDRYDAPQCITIPNPGGTPNPYRPCNAEPEEVGTYSLRTAMELSVNTVYAPLARDVGLRKVMDAAGAAGLAPPANLKTNLANSLGVEVTPISVATAYSTLVNHGVRHDPRTVLAIRSGGSGGADAGDIVREEPAAPAGQQALPADVADTVRDVLRGVVDRGTGTAARQDFPVYGKTGTTDDFTNAWFAGCTPELCLVTWMGYNSESLPSGQPNSMRNVEGVGTVMGGTLPAQVFAQALANYRELRPGAGGLAGSSG